MLPPYFAWPLLMLLPTPSLTPATRPDDTTLHLVLTESKPVYDEHEPVVVRLWLANSGKRDRRVVRGNLRFTRDPGPPRGNTVLDLCRGGIWLTEANGEPLTSDHVRPQRRLWREDPGWRESIEPAVGIGPGRAGGRIEVRYWRVPPGGRVLLAERRGLLEPRTFRDSAGRRFHARSRLSPGDYQVHAVLRAVRPDVGGRTNGPRPASAERTTSVELRTSVPIRVVPSRPEFLRRRAAIEALRTGCRREAVDAALGPAQWERAVDLVTGERGPIHGTTAGWSLGPLASAPSPYPWGRVALPAVRAWFTADERRLIRLEARFYAERQR